MELCDRFWSKVDKNGPNDCWEWAAGCFTNGYGCFSIGRKSYRAHRLVYENANGPIPNNLYVCHTCDNPKCVNPEHLWLGTNSDNMKDMYKKGRGGPPSTQKLTEEQVLMIREDKRSQSIIAKEYGVRQTTISRIKLKKIWRDI